MRKETVNCLSYLGTRALNHRDGSRYRWQIELFFKWLKCILNCRHWFAESPQGLTLEVYCALIASVQLVLWTGQRLTKRPWEALQLYWMGWVSLAELTRLMVARKNTE